MSRYCLCGNTFRCQSTAHTPGSSALHRRVVDATQNWSQRVNSASSRSRRQYWRAVTPIPSISTAAVVTKHPVLSRSTMGSFQPSRLAWLRVVAHSVSPLVRLLDYRAWWRRRLRSEWMPAASAFRGQDIPPIDPTQDQSRRLRDNRVRQQLSEHVTRLYPEGGIGHHSAPQTTQARTTPLRTDRPFLIDCSSCRVFDLPLRSKERSVREFLAAAGFLNRSNSRQPGEPTFDFAFRDLISWLFLGSRLVLKSSP